MLLVTAITIAIGEFKAAVVDTFARPARPLNFGSIHRLLSGSFLGIPERTLNMN